REGGRSTSEDSPDFFRPEEIVGSEEQLRSVPKAEENAPLEDDANKALGDIINAFDIDEKAVQALKAGEQAQKAGRARRANMVKEIAKGQAAELNDVQRQERLALWRSIIKKSPADMSRAQLDDMRAAVSGYEDVQDVNEKAELEKLRRMLR
ncbi:hypothetical protein KW786_01080, partial [Candidatus Parcubacteria bacterium]|nr:hypothetical protein [Candidatus Parcubacteria bacterium]